MIQKGLPMKTYNNLRPVEPAKPVTDLRSMMESTAQIYGERPVFIYRENGEKKQLTYNEFWEDIRAFGTGLYQYGLAGKRIAVVGDTHPAWLTAFIATISTGGVIVPLDKELDGDQMVEFLKIAECSALVYTASMAKRIDALRKDLAFLDYLIPAVAEEGDADVLPLGAVIAKGQEALEGGDTAFMDLVPDTDAMASIMFTSGTSGTSKGVVLSHKNFVASINASCDCTQYDKDDVLVAVLPIHHAYELICGELSAYNMGITICICDGLRYASRNFKEYNPTALILVPLFLETVHKKIWDEIKKKKMEKKVRAAMALSNSLLKVGVDLRPKFFREITSAFGENLKSIIVGGAPIDPGILSDFYSFGITVQQGYGITECSPLVACNRAGRIKFHSVGEPVLGCEVKIDPLPESTKGEGEILVKGDNVMPGYYKNDEANRAVFTEDGWFRTGDVGTVDKDGFVTITGRLKNVIIASNGKNVYPEELEEKLLRVPAVRECVVLGREEASGEVVITAIIVPNYDVLGEGTTDTAASFILKEAIAQVNRTLPPYKHINHFEVRHEDFEKTPSKKIKRFLVK